MNERIKKAIDLTKQVLADARGGGGAERQLFCLWRC